MIVNGIETNKNIRKREVLFRKQGGLCAYCDNPIPEPRRGILEHVIPRSKGGRNHMGNRKLVCRTCDTLKANLTSLEDAIAHFEKVKELFIRLRQKGIC